jgi:hypothetical protein
MEVIIMNELEDEIEVVPAVSNYPLFLDFVRFLINPPAWQEAREDARGGDGPARVRGKRPCCGAAAGK